MKAVLLYAAYLAIGALSVAAQTVTTTNALGYTIVEEVTLNQLGLPTTEVVSTVLTPPTASNAPTTSPSTTTTTTPLTSTATTPAAAAQGPVEQSPTDGVAGPTSYIYSTTNAAGATITVAAIFTPTYQPASDPVPTGTGTILQYSQWIAALGTHTVPTSPNAALPRWSGRPWLHVAGGTLLAMLSGALTVFA